MNTQSLPPNRVGLRQPTRNAIRPLLLLLVAMIPVAARSQITYALSDDGTYAYVTNSPDAAGDIIIADTYLGLPVTRIGDGAFNWATDLTGITLPNTVTSIGDHAFDYCPRLTRLSIPNNVTNIGAYAFSYCHALPNIIIPESVTGIGESAFLGCSGLTNISVAFDNPAYRSVAGVLFDRNVTMLLVCPAGLSGAYVVPEGVAAIGDGAFSGCFDLNKIFISNGVTNIGGYAFISCSGLANITIPESVTSIGQQAFAYCWSLTGVIIPKSVTALGDELFYDCIHLGSISTETGNPAYQSLDGVLFDRSLTRLVAFPAGRAGSYAVPDSVTGVGVHAFELCSFLQRVTLGRSVTTLGTGAFADCYSLTSIVLNDGLLQIGDDAFRRCNALQNIVIPESVLVIGSNAFDTSIDGSFPGELGPPLPFPLLGDLSAYFLGGAPTADNPFGEGNEIAVYHLAEKPGWGPTFGGAPTTVWLPHITTGDGQFGVRDGKFGFNLSWVPGSRVVVEATDNLPAPNWTPLATQVLDASGNAGFSDPDWANHPTRLYRVRLP